MKVVSLDFEMSGLNADFGILLCGVFQEVGKKAQVMHRFDDQPEYVRGKTWSDKELAIKLRDEINQADIIVTWNGKRFDIPFLNARLFFHGQEPCKRVKHIDLMYQPRYKWKIHSSRLDSVLDHLQAPAEFTKTRMKPYMWIKALQGNKPAMDYVVHHCKQDVKALDWVYAKVKSLVNVIHP